MWDSNFPIPPEGRVASYPEAIKWLLEVREQRPGIAACDGLTISRTHHSTYRRGNYRHEFVFLYHSFEWFIIRLRGEKECHFCCEQTADSTTVATGSTPGLQAQLGADAASEHNEGPSLKETLGEWLASLPPTKLQLEPLPERPHQEITVVPEKVPEWVFDEMKKAPRYQEEERMADYVPSTAAWAKTHGPKLPEPPKPPASIEGDAGNIRPIFSKPDLEPVRITAEKVNQFWDKWAIKRKEAMATLGFGWDAPPFHPIGAPVEWVAGKGDHGPERAHWRSDAADAWTRFRLWAGNFDISSGNWVEARPEVLRSAPIGKKTMLYRRLPGCEAVTGVKVAGCVPLATIQQLETRLGIFELYNIHEIKRNGVEYEVAHLRLRSAPFRWTKTPVRKFVNTITLTVFESALRGTHPVERISVKGEAAYPALHDDSALPSDVQAIRTKYDLMKSRAPQRVKAYIGDLRSEASMMKDISGHNPDAAVQRLFELDRIYAAQMGEAVPFSINLE